MHCFQAWAECGANRFVEVINAVRNRILDFSLAVWKECPTAGQLGGRSNESITPAHVTQIFHTTVFDGGSATVVGSAPHSSIAATVVQGDLKSLQDALSNQGLSAADITAVSSALKEEHKPSSTDALDPGVSAWLGRMAIKAAEGTLKAGGAIAIKEISAALMRYYGFAP
jgi:hypothetical protein